MKKLKFLRPVPIVVLLAIFIFAVSIPGVAFAFDPTQGAKNTLEFFKIIVMIVILISAVMAFLRHQVAVTIAVILVGSILYALTTPGLPEKVGTGILKLVGGE